MISPTATRRLILAAFAEVACLGLGARAEVPNVLRDVGIDQRLDAPVPLDLSFHNENGATVCLHHYFDSTPFILVLAYYRCPMLCMQVLNGLVNSMRHIDLELG